MRLCESREVAKDIKKRLKTDALPPHVFTVSQTAYYNLCKTQVNVLCLPMFLLIPSTNSLRVLPFQTNQSMIVCGESGSGKTESAKHLMRFVSFSFCYTMF